MSTDCRLVLRTRSSHKLPEFTDASFGFKSGTSKNSFASVLIDSEVRTSGPQVLTNFGIGTLVLKRHKRAASCAAIVAKNVSRASRFWLAKSCEEKIWLADSFHAAIPRRNRDAFITKPESPRRACVTVCLRPIARRTSTLAAACDMGVFRGVNVTPNPAADRRNLWLGLS